MNLSYITHYFLPMQACISGLILLALYSVAITIYRLYFSPIASIPGPRLAAATCWYEFYFDVIKRGRYYREIERMHQKYGSVVRISPYEIHVNDPAFYPRLYTTFSHRRDKWAWAAKMFGTGHSAFATLSHDHHRLRRAALNPFFSKAKVRQLEPHIQETIRELGSRLDESCEHGNELDLGAAFAAFAADVISAYCFGQPFGLLKDPGFAPDWFATTRAPSELSHLIKQCNWVLPLCRSMPRRVVAWVAPAIDRLFTLQEWNHTRVQNLANSRPDKDAPDSRHCVFEGLLNSSLLPAEEKSVERLKHEAQTLIGAGTLTVAHALNTIIFHTLADATLHHVLVNELSEAFPDPRQELSLDKLEKLPILTSYITEGLRLAYGVSHRLQLLAPEPLCVNDQVMIPPGTPVGMSAISMHNNPLVFPEPRSFLPKRWRDAEQYRNLTRHFVPFSRGTRMCLGMHLAWAELYLVLGTIFRHYTLSLYDTSLEDVEMEHDFFDPVPRLGTRGLRVLIKKR